MFPCFQQLRHQPITTTNFNNRVSEWVPFWNSSNLKRWHAHWCCSCSIKSDCTRESKQSRWPSFYSYSLSALHKFFLFLLQPCTCFFPRVISSSSLNKFYSELDSLSSITANMSSICTFSAYRPMLSKFLYSEQASTIQRWPIVKLSICSHPKYFWDYSHQLMAHWASIQ